MRSSGGIHGGVELVTYERRPYGLLPESAFIESMELDGEKLRFCDAGQKNLGAGRGRVRRICVLTEDRRQVNLLANSERPAHRLIEIMRGRWTQENGFKHGAERWGLNQLDARTVRPYPPEAIIPNPARRRLDHALRIARVQEGDVRSQLARLPADNPRRGRLEQTLSEAMKRQKNLEALRPSTPTHAPVEETELAGKLVHHELEYKLTVDTIRIACANAESDLAVMLAPYLPKPAEAKRTLTTLFAAPGRIHVTPTSISITLSPAGTARELVALQRFAGDFNRGQFNLPGDQHGRLLRLRIQQHS